MAGERLAKYISDQKEPEGEKTDIVFGEVTSTRPLRVRVENRFTIEENFLILSQMVRDLTLPYYDTVTSSQSGVVAEGNVVLSTSNSERMRHIQIFRDLRIGDHVRMIKGQKSQLFYILERSDSS